MTMQFPQVAVIGLGRIGMGFDSEVLRLKPATHVGGWRAVRGISLVALCDSDPALAASGAGFVGEDHVYTDYGRMLERHRELDIISVATPVETHHAIVCDIAQRRAAKVIFCEKPVARTVAEASQMIESCKNHGVKLAVNHTRRWSPAYRNVIGAVNMRASGHITAVTAYYSGTPMNVGIHMADLLNWINIENGCVHSLPTDYLLFELDILMTGGRVRIQDHSIESFKIGPSIFYDGIREPYMQFSERVAGYSMYEPCHQLVDCLKNGVQPYCTGENGLAALQRVVKWRAKDGNGH